jgi:hypothetical protein
MAAPAIPIKGKPGTYFIPSTGQTFRAQELTEDSFYDAQVIPPGAVTAGNYILQFFDANPQKNYQHTNIKQVRRIPQQVEFSMTRIGIVMAQATGGTLAPDSDSIQILNTGALRFYLSKQEIARGPLFMFPSGYGAVGSTTRNNTGVVTNGVGSPAAVPPLVVTQPVNKDDDLDSDIRFDGATWINGQILQLAGTQVASYVVPTLAQLNVLLLDLHGIKKVSVTR